MKKNIQILFLFFLTVCVISDAFACYAQVNKTAQSMEKEQDQREIEEELDQIISFLDFRALGDKRGLSWIKFGRVLNLYQSPDLFFELVPPIAK